MSLVQYASLLLTPWVIALYPPFKRAFLYPWPSSRAGLDFLEICDGNRNAQMVLELQYFVLARTCDDKTCRQLMSLDPAQSKIYCHPIADEDIFIPGYTHAMLDRYAQAILEVGFLSLSTALLPNAARTWLDTVLAAFRFFHRSESFKTPSLFIYAPIPLVYQEFKSGSNSSDKGLSGLSISPYAHSLNFSTES